MTTKIVFIEVLFRFIDQLVRKAGSSFARIRLHSRRTEQRMSSGGGVYGVLISGETPRHWL